MLYAEELNFDHPARFKGLVIDATSGNPQEVP
jgi:hypothetical protein